uniref:Unkown protein n=1 Tax=Riptortus pedestris TaxID=329032 RepID=R4WQJ0_RIPPE|nr:unkown protein [Riptortus pedestris]
MKIMNGLLSTCMKSTAQCPDALLPASDVLFLLKESFSNGKLNYEKLVSMWLRNNSFFKYTI